MKCPKCKQEILVSPLKISQKVVKLSKDRLGLYLNRDIVRSLGLKGGQEILVSVPEKGTIVFQVKS